MTVMADLPAVEQPASVICWRSSALLLHVRQTLDAATGRYQG